MIFTQNQENVIRQGVHWFLNESEQLFEISGLAGTGKSVVLNEIVRRCNLKPYEIMPMAYTGSTAIVMRTKGFENARSIHSSLYELVKVKLAPSDSIPMDLKYNVDKYEYKFVPKKFIDPIVKLFIIDEGYMVPKYMKRIILKYGIKVLVAGDCHQLPPIGDEAGFLTGYNIHYLTEIMRQNIDNPIIYLANRAINGLPIHNGIYGNQALVINRDELSYNMIHGIGNIICAKNKTRDNYNEISRQLFNHRDMLPEFGERIICRNNNWKLEHDGVALVNGLQGYVVNKYDPKNTLNKDTFKIDFLPDVLNTPFEQIDLNFEYFKSDYSKKNEIRNMKMFSDNKKYQFMKGDFFEYAYSITTHLAQGSEYPAGIYLEEYLNPKIQNQLLYTGITRFKQYMIYVKNQRRYY